MIADVELVKALCAIDVMLESPEDYVRRLRLHLGGAGWVFAYLLLWKGHRGKNAHLKKYGEELLVLLNAASAIDTEPTLEDFIEALCLHTANPREIANELTIGCVETKDPNGFQFWNPILEGIPVFFKNISPAEGLKPKSAATYMRHA